MTVVYEYQSVGTDGYIDRSTNTIPTYFRESEYKKQYATELGCVELLTEIVPVDEVDRGIEIVSLFEKHKEEMLIGDLGITPSMDVAVQEILQMLHEFKDAVGNGCILLEDDSLPSFVKTNKGVPTELLWYKGEITDE